MRQNHLKNLMRSVQKTIPDNDPGTGVLVHPEEVKEELSEIRRKESLIKRFENYKRADDLIQDFTLDAAKRIIYEMEFGRTSGDRRAAAKDIMHQGLGKPVERTFNITAEVNQYTDKEVDAKIDALLNELGYKNAEEASANLLIEDDRRQNDND